jgi:hypothetical protein
VATRFQIDVERRPAREIARSFDRDDFSVMNAFIGVKTFADHMAIAHENCSDQRIWAGERYASGRQFERAIHEDRIGRDFGGAIL